MVRGAAGEAAQHSLLPEIVKALHVGVAARLARGDEAHLDAKEEREAHRLREDARAAGVARERGLVVDLPDPRQAKAGPRDLHEVGAEALRALVRELPGGGTAASDVDGVEGEEEQRPPRGAQVARPHEIGLLEIAPRERPRRGVAVRRRDPARRGVSPVRPWRSKMRSIVRREGTRAR